MTFGLGEGWPEEVFSFKEGQTTKEPFGELTVLCAGHTGTLLLNPGAEPHPLHPCADAALLLPMEQVS